MAVRGWRPAGPVSFPILLISVCTASAPASPTLNLSAVAYDLELDLLPPIERGQTGLLDGRNVHKYILPAALRLNESIAFGQIKSLHSPGRHSTLQDGNDILRRPYPARRPRSHLVVEHHPGDKAEPRRHHHHIHQLRAVLASVSTMPREVMYFGQVALFSNVDTWTPIDGRHDVGPQITPSCHSVHDIVRTNSLWLI